MELVSVFRFNLVLLMLSSLVLNVALVLATSAGGASALEQAQPSLSESADTADEDLSYYRQPLSINQDRLTRSGSPANKVSFLPSYRFGSIRLITPYALQHLLASRFQNNDYPGKRMGSEFLGKKRSQLAPFPYGAGESGSSAGSRDFDSAYAVMQKKMGSEFLGRRKRSTDTLGGVAPISHDSQNGPANKSKRRIITIPRIGKKNDNKSPVMDQQQQQSGQPEVVDSTWSAPDAKRNEYEDILESWRDLYGKGGQPINNKDDNANTNGKVKKFNGHSHFISSFEGGSHFPFVFYTKGNEFLGGPGKR